MNSFEATLVRLEVVPGLGRRTGEVVVAEVGVDLARFPTAGHLASWAGLCPGNHERAGKRLSGHTRKGSPWLRTALLEAAQAAGRSKETSLSAQYHPLAHPLAARRGAKRAAVAVAHSLLVIIDHLLTHPERAYEDLGATYFDQRDRQAVERRLVKRLEALGHTVILQPAPPAA